MSAMNHGLRTFLIPLPDVIGIPNGLVCRYQYDDRGIPYLSAAARSPVTTSEVLSEPGAGLLDVAIQVWMAPSVATLSEMVATAAAVAVAEHLEGKTPKVEQIDVTKMAPDQGLITGLVSVAEATVFWDTAAEAATDGQQLAIDDTSDPLLRAIHCVQHLVRAYRIGTGTLIADATYMRLPRHILAADRSLDQANHPPKFTIVSRLGHDNFRASLPVAARPDDLARWQASVALLSAGDPLALFIERHLEAQRAYLKEGDHGLAVVQVAIAAEILLDEVLGLLLWESAGGAPAADGPTDEAAKRLSGGLRTRVKREYAPLIGGPWSLDRPGPVQSWDRDVAALRNRVVHRGYRPRSIEVEAALEAVTQLHDFMLDRVSAHARTFPRTALMVVSEEGLKNRQVWPLIRKFAEDQRLREPPWRDHYRAWRDRVDVQKM